MSRVLVTGASGFIGWHLTSLLVERGHEVTCLVRKTSATDRLRPLGVRLVHGDVTDRDSLPPAIAESDVVYHLAGRTMAAGAEQFHRVNEQGVVNVVRACAERATPPVTVLVSSLAAAGPAVDGRLRTEADPPAPVSQYGRSKRAGEVAAEPWADRVPITVVRPPIVFGETDRATFEIFRMISRFRMHVVPGWGRSRFSLIHAADLAQLLVLAAERGDRLPVGENGNSTGYYFAACEEHPPYVQLGRMMAEALDRRMLIMPTIPSTIWSIAAVNQFLSTLSPQASALRLDKAREVRAGSWLCSPGRAVDQLGFSVAAPLADRLRQTAQWYRREGWL